MSRRLRSLVALLAAAGCSGGGGTPAAPDPALLKGAVVIHIPAKPANAHLRQPKYVSASAQSIAIAMSGIRVSTVANIGPSSPNCTMSSAGRTCDVTVLAPSGTVTFTLTICDGPNATGNILSTGSATQTVSGGGFNVSVTTLGRIGSVELAMNPPQTTFYVGLRATATLTAMAKDADGNVIVGTYDNPIALANSDTTGTFTLSASTFAASGQTITLKYSGAATPPNATITPSISGSPNLPPVSLTVAAPHGSQSFSYTGTQQDFAVPVGVTQVTVTASGAGDSAAGALVTATIPVTPGESLPVFVGGAGNTNGGVCCGDGGPGYNGGGRGGQNAGGAGGGGGASDVREGGNALANRVIVAGGGGGGGGGKTRGGAGGGGGRIGGAGDAGTPCTPCGGPGGGGGGGSQIRGGPGGKGGTAGGPSGSSGFPGGSGVLGGGGRGGNGGSVNCSTLPCGPDGGGGGGGYYGGGGAGGGGSGSEGYTSGGAGGGGGGGSSYVEPKATNRTYVQGGGSTGNGAIAISWGSQPESSTRGYATRF